MGDFGLQDENDWHMANIDPSKHQVNFGNHDYNPYVDKPHSCGHFRYFRDWKIMTIRGALSSDKHLRLEGYDLFENDEELNYDQMGDALDLYISVKPEIMITHDCPQSVMMELFDFNENTKYYKSGTRQGLQSAFEIHQPAIWLFGHYHRSKDEMINGTRFICLAELETFNI